MGRKRLSCLLVFLIFIVSSFSQVLTWHPTFGPSGCDATSFFMDKKGNYWLGTGSSGGVYFSKNKGKSWEARNNGIGPVHIAQINEIHDTIYIQVSDNSFNKNGAIRYYWWHPRSMSWNLLKQVEIKSEDLLPVYKVLANKYKGKNIDSIYPDDFLTASRVKLAGFSNDPIMRYDTIQSTYIKWLGDTLNTLALTNTSGINKEYPLLNFSPSNTWYSNTDYLAMEWGVYPYTIAWGANSGVWEGYIFSHISGFYESDPRWAQLNKFFPRDMFKLPAGNLFLDSKYLLLLAKSGIYKSDGNNIGPLPVKNLVATDVRQIIITDDQIIYALVGESDIWQYKNDKWKCVFNAYSYHIKSTSGVSPAGYDTKLMNLQTNGSILFCFCGEVWQIDKSGKPGLVIKSGFLPDLPGRVNQKLYYTSMTLDKEGSLFGVADNVYYNDYKSYFSKDNRISETLLVKFKSTGSPPEIIKVIDRSNDWYGYLAFVFSDRNGMIWLKGDGKICQLGSGSDTTNYYKTKANRWINGFAFAANGDIYYLNGSDKIVNWNSRIKKWIELATPELKGIQCIGVDTDNTLYAGTGYSYHASCGNYLEGMAQGLYRLCDTSWIKIEGDPNPWILSLGNCFNKGIAVGTSGSGMWITKKISK